MTEELLIPVDKYLAAGVHIGTQQRESSMEPFIYNIRPDGLSVFNIQLIDKRIRQASKFVAKYPKEEILLVASRDNARDAAEKFGEITGSVVMSQRFMPGTLTNPAYRGYTEPRLLIVADPTLDSRAIAEALVVGTPIIAFCDTSNNTKNIDFIIPGNNKGRKAIATLFWLLGNEISKARGELAEGQEPKYTLEQFQPEQ